MSSTKFKKPQEGGTKAILSSSSPVIGVPIISTLQAGYSATFQFFTMTALGVRANVGAASAAGSLTHTYTPVTADNGKSVGCDISDIRSATFGNIVTAPPTYAPTAAPTGLALTALAGAVSLAYTPVPSAGNGGSAITGYQWQKSGGTTPLTGISVDNPIVIASDTAPITVTLAAVNAVGVGPSSTSNTATAAPATIRLIGTNYNYPTTVESLGNGATESMGRNVHTFGSGNSRNIRVRLPTGCSSNGGDVSIGAFTARVYLEFRGITRPFLFNGQIIRNVSAAEEPVISDPIDPTPWGITEFPVDEDFYLRYKLVRADATVTTCAGHTIAFDDRNYAVIYNPANVTSTSDVAGVGNMSVTGTSAINVRSLGYSPMPLGEYVQPANKTSFLAYGASMEAAGTDTAFVAPLRSGPGLLRATRGPDGVTGSVSGARIAVPGNSTTSMGGVNTATYDYFQYFNKTETSLGGNDLGSMNGSTVRQKYYDIEKYLRGLWAIMRVRSPGIQIGVLLKPPCITASSDAFATTAGQTVGTEWSMTNGSNAPDPVGLGEYYRTWQAEQINGGPSATFTASINNVIMTVSALTLPGRRIAIGDVVTATGYSGTIVGVNTTAADGTGSYTITPAVPAGLSSRAFTAAVINGVDFVFGTTEGITAPGRRDLWAVASTTGLGLPGDAPLGAPSPTGSGGNHPATNHYIVLAKKLRSAFFGIVD